MIQIIYRRYRLRRLIGLTSRGRGEQQQASDMWNMMLDSSLAALFYCSLCGCPLEVLRPTLPLPCVSTAFAAKSFPLPPRLRHCICLVVPLPSRLRHRLCLVCLHCFRG